MNNALNFALCKFPKENLKNLNVFPFFACESFFFFFFANLFNNGNVLSPKSDMELKYMTHWKCRPPPWF